MKAISLWEPWASAMALGLKKNETRSWATSFRGDLVICSSKRKMGELECEVWTEHVQIDPGLEPVYGCALCVVHLYDCVVTQYFLSGMGNLDDLEQSLGNYTYGRFAWRTRDLRRIMTPVQVKGKQGLFDLPEATAEIIRKQIEQSE